MRQQQVRRPAAQLTVSGFQFGLLIALGALGLSLIYGTTGLTNFAHGEFLMLAMYISFFLFAFFAIDPLLSMPLVGAAISPVGLVPVYSLAGASRNENAFAVVRAGLNYKFGSY